VAAKKLERFRFLPGIQLMTYLGVFRQQSIIVCGLALGFSLGTAVPACFAEPNDDASQSTTVSQAHPAGTTSDASLFPPSSVFFLEVSDPKGLMDLVFDHSLRPRIESLGAFKAAMATAAYKQFSLGLLMLEGQLKMPWREALDSLLGQGVVIGFDAKTDGFAVVLHGKDADSVALIRDRMLEFGRLTGNGNQITEGEYRGVKAVQLNAIRFAVYENRLLITNQSDTGKWILDRMIDHSDSRGTESAESPVSGKQTEDALSLLDNPRYQAFRDSVGSESQVQAFLDLQVLGQVPAVSGALQSKINNPLVELLVGGIQSALSDSAWASAQLSVDKERVELALSTPFELATIPEQREYYFGVNGGGRGLSLPPLPETLFTLSTHRDFSDVWLRAGDLFDANVNDGIAQADATLTTLFAGRDFGEDILAAFEPEVAFVAVRQEFADTQPQPTIKLPAFAAVFELKQPDSMRRELRRTFQSLVGFLNVVGAMNGQKQLELGGETLGETAELFTSFYVPEEGDLEAYDAELIFNFSPSIAFRGKQFVIASSTTLARQLVTKSGGQPNHGSKNTDATLHAKALRQVLQDNREQLIAQRMLEDGNTRDEATALIDLLLTVVGYFKEASVTLVQDDKQLQAAWEVRLKP
jgi:hypothetical protein